MFHSNKIMRIKKIVKEGKGKRKVVFENDAGERLLFSYDGEVWHWYETNHIVEPQLSKKLNKALKRWLRKEGKSL